MKIELEAGWIVGTRDPMTLTFQPQNISLVGYRKAIPYTKSERCGIIHF